MTHESKTISYLNIEINDKTITEMDDINIVIQLPVDEINTISYKYGCTAERPLVNIILGIIFIGSGLHSLPSIYYWFTEGGTITEFDFVIPMLSVLGLWLISTVVISRHYLHVFTVNDSRKLILRGDVVRDELDCFLTQIYDAIKIEVTDTI